MQKGSVLAIETSCDETAVAVLDAEGRMRASLVASQAGTHARYGGVVPEVASRSHLETIGGLVDRALEESGLSVAEIETFAATAGPGLATSLMIGTSFAKGLALGLERNYVGVNHMEGHLLSPFFGRESGVRPSIGLVVSGGHTMLVEVERVGVYRVIGRTRDDAAGEAFDKVAKLLGLGYPGGPEISRMALEGDPKAFDLPRSMMHSGDLDFSFSGMKTAVRYLLPKLSVSSLPDVCASFQEAVVEVLVSKSLAALRERGCRILTVSGGVSCNARLREALAEACSRRGFELLLAESSLCTDNAGMIASAARYRAIAGLSSSVCSDINPNLALGSPLLAEK